MFGTFCLKDNVPFVFISHIDTDKDRIAALVKQLIVRGVNVWIDNPDKLSLPIERVEPVFGKLGRIELGQTWTGQLESALKRTNGIVIVWTQDSMQAIEDQPRRRVFKSEVDMAISRDIAIPIALDERPKMAAPREAAFDRYRKLQAAGLIGWPHAATADASFESAVAKMRQLGVFSVFGVSRDPVNVATLADLGREALDALNGANAGDGGASLFALADVFAAHGRPAGDAIRLLRAAMSFGNAAAMAALADRLDRGDGLARDPQQAQELWAQAAAREFPRAQYKMGVLLQGVDPAAARRWWGMAAASGHRLAQYNLASAAYEGCGGGTDLHLALINFEASAAQSYSPAAFMAGCMWEDGHAGGKDIARAVEYYRRVLTIVDDPDGDALVPEAQAQARRRLTALGYSPN